MCIKIIRTKEETEFDPGEPLEYQVRGAKQIVVSYEPGDSGIQSFMDQVERIVKTGVSCQMNIKVNANNTLDGMRVERHLERLKMKMDVNEVAKALTKFHQDADQKLMELSSMCVEKN